MTRIIDDGRDSFENAVDLRYRLYNSLFLSLPFHGIEKTGALLTLFAQTCETGFESSKTSPEIVDSFFQQNTSLTSDKERIDMLFRFVQYAERQVVLFDAIEDASFSHLHDMGGIGTLRHLEKAASRSGKTEELLQRLGEFGIRLVLTAHPTQFYPGVVLGIINDLSAAIESNDTPGVKLLLQQLGRTPFFKKEKPTPYDEAVALIWYLENVFYSSIGEIVSDLHSNFPGEKLELKNLIRMGFWSGGDRDGNPFVTVATTRLTADALRRAILRCYHGDLRLMRRRLTFAGVEELLAALEQQVYENAFRESNNLTGEDIRRSLIEIRELINSRHNGLFAQLVSEMITKVEIFGLSMASLDIRQDSSVHTEIYAQLVESGDIDPGFSGLQESEAIEAILGLSGDLDPDSFDDELTADTFRTIREMREIQKRNGPASCSRYIISHSQGPLDVLRVFGLFLLNGYVTEDIAVDIVPLFETVEDLRNSADVMRKLYENETYRNHLKRRDDVQTVMVGFSDGTKDGGYLMANFGIYAAKRALTEVSREFGIDVVFFDGRGGPPARGGGKTHRFYASMGSDISNKAFEVTVQGQTVSSNFGTVDAARYNIEQMLHAGGYGPVLRDERTTFSDTEEGLFRELAEVSFEAYFDLKEDPAFLNYLENATPLKYYAMANIGSRPSKRGGKEAKLTLDSLRAIPFVGAWSQMKQNVPGFYGVGTALESAKAKGKLEDVAKMYRNNEFFKALLDNCEMAMQKTYLPLTAHLRSDDEFAAIWEKIAEEFERCKEHMAFVTGKQTFMTDFPVAQQSVTLREKIVLPLTTIQQFALDRIRADDTNGDAYKKLVVRCAFGIINAGRNSA
ncbi:MAG: phosphoenolpyruvate carboxylase [Pyrinomonadaceae bacterium]|nr:phosphoenolpyruvate carboxylase [Pyrinomonadaceae bacterium]